MLPERLEELYRGYIDCLNAQDWDRLGEYVGGDVHYNGKHVGLAGYRAMLERDFREIPDLRFNIELLVANETHVASVLAFDCSPQGEFLGLAVNGKKIAFTENVFYEFRDGKIVNVRSLLDKLAVEAQISKR
ncbi:ester cyclase [Thalassospira indica]|uniref:Ester cyclase n=1 Tax=Thalassospira indica TaxID=1891279 RepID=A0ABM6Y028_9PROT|nr:ester cyclase [Thalassospira indica]AXO15296.1 ester cyclase [Thalassospira indica]OAZ12615.1 ester cyclase [Thalassospira profundimaris]